MCLVISWFSFLSFNWSCPEVYVMRSGYVYIYFALSAPLCSVRKVKLLSCPVLCVLSLIQSSCVVWSQSLTTSQKSSSFGVAHDSCLLMSGINWRPPCCFRSVPAQLIPSLRRGSRWVGCSPRGDRRDGSGWRGGRECGWRCERWRTLGWLMCCTEERREGEKKWFWVSGWWSFRKSEVACADWTDWLDGVCVLY